MSTDPVGEPPLLTYEVARAIGEFPEFTMTVTDDDLVAYTEATGTPPPGSPPTGTPPPGDTVPPGTVVPPGYAAVFGRLGYLRQHRMPGGGVLLGQEIHWLRPAAVGEPMAIKSVVESAQEDDRGRRKVVIVTTARQYGVPVATVRITAGWPA